MARAGVVHPAIAGTAAWQRATAEYVDRLREHYGERLAAVVLFGSRARGDADEGSDVDLLVVLGGDDDVAEQRIVSGLTHDLESKYDFPLLCAIVATEEDYRRRMLPLFMNVRREGIELWPVGQTAVREDSGEYGEPSQEDIDMIMERARTTLREGTTALALGSINLAVNRAYYSMFHAATALLTRKGLAFSSHRAVIAGFNEQYVKTGQFPIETSKRLSEAFSARGKADYSYRDRIPEEEAAGRLRSAAAFAAEAERLLGS